MAPEPAAHPGNHRLLLLACILGSAMVFIDTTVVNVGLAAVGAGLHVGLGDQQWVVEAYLLALGSLVLIGGSLGDVLGRRRVFAAGVAGFGAASLGCALAPSIGVLIVARATQGVAAALLVPSSLAIITATSTPVRRGAMIGAWTASTSAAAAAGPPLGGLLIDLASWRLIFAINLPLAGATLWLIARHVPELPRRAQALDLPGALLCAAGLGGPVYALIHEPGHGWASIGVLLPLLAGLLLMAAFLVHERRTPEPMLSLELFAIRSFAAANAATVAVWGSLGATTFLVPLFLQQVAGYGALGAGLALLPFTIMMVALSRRFGALAGRRGARTMLGLGPVCAGIGVLMFARLGARVNFATEIVPAAALLGLGMSATVAPLTATLLGAVPPTHAGVASGVNNALARVAGLLAIALVGLVVATRFGSALDAGLPAGDALTQQRAADVRPLRVSQAPVELRPAVRGASVSAYRAGIVVCALLMAAGGPIAWGGVRAQESGRRRSGQMVAPSGATLRS